MPRVKVTFYVDGEDPDHDTGVSEEQNNDITDAIMAVGGEDIYIEKQAD